MRKLTEVHRITEIQRRFLEDLETVAEAALCTGEFGVLVEWQPDMSYTISVSEKVPYGHIYDVRGVERL